MIPPRLALYFSIASRIKIRIWVLVCRSTAICKLSAVVMLRQRFEAAGQRAQIQWTTAKRKIRKRKYSLLNKSALVCIKIFTHRFYSIEQREAVPLLKRLPILSVLLDYCRDLNYNISYSINNQGKYMMIWKRHSTPDFL